MEIVVVLLIVLLLLAALPAWPYSRGWGYYPFGGLLTLALVLLILFYLL
ncbi:MAG: DUF3309 family protein [Nitriliruptorales bacterium]